jgi:hypothetical protein
VVLPQGFAGYTASGFITFPTLLRFTIEFDIELVLSFPTLLRFTIEFDIELVLSLKGTRPPGDDKPAGFGFPCLGEAPATTFGDAVRGEALPAVPALKITDATWRPCVEAVDTFGMASSGVRGVDTTMPPGAQGELGARPGV